MLPCSLVAKVQSLGEWGCLVEGTSCECLACLVRKVLHLLAGVEHIGGTTQSKQHIESGDLAEVTPQIEVIAQEWGDIHLGNGVGDIARIRRHHRNQMNEGRRRRHMSGGYFAASRQLSARYQWQGAMTQFAMGCSSI
eukprot:1140325-Pelagomonas_calceolata.AAC.3